MRLIFLLVALLAAAFPATAQQPPASPGDAGMSPGQGSGAEVSVSLDRIRDALRKPLDPVLYNLDVKPDFTLQVEEQAHINEILSKLDFGSGPAPAGGLYGYEQQRRLFDPTTRPLQQPYAAFSGGEFITIAIENLVGRYLAGRAGTAVTSAERAHAEAQAHDEVEQAIAEYCGQQANRDEIALCTSQP